MTSTAHCQAATGVDSLELQRSAPARSARTLTKGTRTEMSTPVPFSATDYIELFFDVFETSSDAIYITRVDDGVILDANDQTLSLMGYTRAEAIGHSTIELGLWARPGGREEFIAALREKGRVRRYRVRFRTKSSEEFTFELSATMTQLRGEDVVLGVGVVAKRA